MVCNSRSYSPPPGWAIECEVPRKIFMGRRYFSACASMYEYIRISTSDHPNFCRWKQGLVKKKTPRLLAEPGRGFWISLRRLELRRVRRRSWLGGLRRIGRGRRSRSGLGGCGCSRRRRWRRLGGLDFGSRRRSGGLGGGLIARAEGQGTRGGGEDEQGFEFHVVDWVRG
jgi:hypothetical protein